MAQSNKTGLDRTRRSGGPGSGIFVARARDFLGGPPRGGSDIGGLVREAPQRGLGVRHPGPQRHRLFEKPLRLRKIAVRGSSQAETIIKVGGRPRFGIRRGSRRLATIPRPDRIIFRGAPAPIRRLAQRQRLIGPTQRAGIQIGKLAAAVRILRVEHERLRQKIGGGGIAMLQKRDMGAGMKKIGVVRIGGDATDQPGIGFVQMAAADLHLRQADIGARIVGPLLQHGVEYRRRTEQITPLRRIHARFEAGGGW